MSYSVFKEAYDESTVYVSDIPAGLVRKYELLKGVPRLASWPKDLTVDFAKSRPEGMNLTDSVPNTFGWLLVSGRLKALLIEAGAADLEHLPVKVRNHKKRIASEDYWIENFLTFVEAVDRGQSAFDVDAADDELIFAFTRLVLLDSVARGGPPIFRLKEKPRLILVRDDLAQRIQAAGLTGMRFTPVAAYKTYDPADSSA
jgi:hypothetical protein